MPPIPPPCATRAFSAPGRLTLGRNPVGGRNRLRVGTGPGLPAGAGSYNRPDPTRRRRRLIPPCYSPRSRPELDLAEGAAGLPGGEAQRLVGPRLDPRADVLLAVLDRDDLLVVDPAADHLAGDPDTEAVPGIVRILDRAGGLVLGGVHAVEAGQAGLAFQVSKHTKGMPSASK
jgi:hypothetical protein